MQPFQDVPVHLPNFGGSTQETVLDVVATTLLFAGGTAVTAVNSNQLYIANTLPAIGKFVTSTADPYNGMFSAFTIVQTGGPLLIEIESRIIIPPGGVFSLRLTNKGTGSSTVAISLAWWQSNSL